MLVAVALAAAGPARAAPPPLVLFHAPPRAPAEVAAARATIARVAADAGAAFVDLSPAPPPAPTAPMLIARAVELYDALRLDEAVAALDAALAEARATGAAGLRPSELSDLFLYRGLIDTQRGDTARAWDELVRAVTVDPTRILDPARFPPRAVQAFQRAAAQLRAQPTGRLVADLPAACSLVVDGRPVAGATELPYGEHFVQKECPGEQPAGSSVILAEARQELGGARAPIAPPDDDALLGLARERDAKSVLVVAVALSPAGPPTARLRLREVPSGGVVAEAAVALAPGGDGVAVARAATERLIARAEGPAATAPAPPVEPQRWYERPWLWGLAGVAVTAAILVPLAVDRGSATGVTIRPSGTVWP
jgi:hypothetical protein